MIKDLVEHSEQVIAIHYSCENIFDRPDGTSPRITSIAVKNLDTKQTKSFSIHQIAERKGYNLSTLEQHYDQLEKQMLKEFYKFVFEHRYSKWLHWNMCDPVYGFPAIAHRYQVLGGSHVEIQDSKMYDLAALLIEIYGPCCTSHPRLESIVERNKITRQNFLSGEDEADAFASKKYVKLHHSVIRKVDIIHTLLQLEADGQLKTDASLWDQYGYYPQAIGEWLGEKWWLTLIILLLGIISDIAGIMDFIPFIPKN